MSKASLLREMSTEQLEAELAASKRELFDLRVKASDREAGCSSNMRRSVGRLPGSRRSFISVI